MREVDGGECGEVVAGEMGVDGEGGVLSEGVDMKAKSSIPPCK